ncbi:MAG: hypothetical protein U1D96_08210 [Eubacteriales bacterium]|nr:hypothetical protein [Bacillota bacterium]MDP3051595.1 hypothetical protein [Eubacteriales bacterium]MDZ4043460.1 hypothetical protein [Eubacteriales bacterium]MDZ7609321.1 hypothetical protein [Eubacteriales bacterium]
MGERVAWIRNVRIDDPADKTGEQYFNLPLMHEVRGFHKDFSEYKVTPLRSLRSLAELLGISGIYVKDESYRFGLNAFKVLGGSYAIGRRVA